MDSARRLFAVLVVAIATLISAAAPATATTNGLGWGANDAGALGTGSDTSPMTAPTPVSAGAIPAGVALVSVAAGDRFAVAAGSDGNAYSWGINCSGQLGTGTADDCTSGTPSHTSP